MVTRERRLKVERSTLRVCLLHAKAEQPHEEEGVLAIREIKDLVVRAVREPYRLRVLAVPAEIVPQLGFLHATAQRIASGIESDDWELAQAPF